jgi:tRNA threonylcarbamoyladenosine biosynthesis protein TsaB
VDRLTALLTLAIDTTLDACSAAVIDGDNVLASRSEPMQRGHQERLAPLVAETMHASGVTFGDLDRIGVTVGPGSFTGLRVGLAFAKGLGLALAIPCVGVGTLEALAASVPEADGAVAAVVDARRGQIYLQIFQDGRPLADPGILEAEAALRRLGALGQGAVILVGSAADQLKAGLGAAEVVAVQAPDPAAVARLAARRPDPGTPPRPLYLRAPDARLPA